MYTGPGEFQYVAAYAVQLLDLLQTFDQELEWIWRKPLSWIACVFLFVRYGSLATQTALLYQHLYATAYPQTRDQCFKWIVLRTFAPPVFVACIHGTMITRVYALYNRSRRLLFALILLFLSGNACTITLFTRLLVHPWEQNPRCELERVSEPATYILASILPLCLDLTILTFTVKRALSLNRQVHPVPMLRTIVFDGTWAVLVVWSCVAVAVILAACGYIRVSYIIANSWMVTVMSFSATRTVLNVRKYNAPRLRHPDEAETRIGEHIDNATLTAYVPAEGTLMLRSRNGGL